MRVFHIPRLPSRSNECIWHNITFAHKMIKAAQSINNENVAFIAC